MSQSARYDRIGQPATRQPAAKTRASPCADPHAALGGARTVVNVGAGTGSYEPHDRQVLAVEPSDVMVAQRAPEPRPHPRGADYPPPLEDRWTPRWRC